MFFILLGRVFDILFAITPPHAILQFHTLRHAASGKSLFKNLQNPGGTFLFCVFCACLGKGKSFFVCLQLGWKFGADATVDALYCQIKKIAHVTNPLFAFFRGIASLYLCVCVCCVEFVFAVVLVLCIGVFSSFSLRVAVPVIPCDMPNWESHPDLDDFPAERETSRRLG